jgi:nitrate reductase NapE
MVEIAMSVEQEKFSDKPAKKSDERFAVFFLIVVLAPALSIAIVGSYGFAIWMSQLYFGPPGH